MPNGAQVHVLFCRSVYSFKLITRMPAVFLSLFFSSSYLQPLMAAELYFPAEHWVTPLEPSQLEPTGGHGEHDWRVVVPPPVVKKCVAQSTQAFWPALEYLLSLPQLRQKTLPVSA